MASRASLNDAQRQVFAASILLDRVAAQPGAYHTTPREERDDVVLEPTFRLLQEEALVDVGEDGRYRCTERGRRAYAGLLERRQSYLAHFEIFGRVDLAEGSFAEPGDPYDSPRFSDLRVAVAEYKGIDPYRLVFLALLSDEAFFREHDWKFDLAPGSTFFVELEEIVAAQLSAAELGYGTEDGEQVSGEALLEDVILEGARRNRALREREGARQQSLLPEGEAAGGGPEAAEPAQPYDPLRAMASYESSALYVEPIWLADFW